MCMNNKYFLLFILSALFYVCSYMCLANMEYGQVERPFRKHYDAFNRISGKKGYDIPIRMVHKRFTHPDVIGAIAVCYSDGYKGLIEVDAWYWNRMSEVSREQLIFHELGHCSLLEMDHRDMMVDFIDLGRRCPISIMRSYIFSQDEITRCYIPHRLFYINELLNYRKDIKK